MINAFSSAKMLTLIYQKRKIGPENPSGEQATFQLNHQLQKSKENLNTHLKILQINM